jgi:hypothetical protein
MSVSAVSVATTPFDKVHAEDFRPAQVDKRSRLGAPLWLPEPCAPVQHSAHERDVALCQVGSLGLSYKRTWW